MAFRFCWSFVCCGVQSHAFDELRALFASAAPVRATAAGVAVPDETPVRATTAAAGVAVPASPSEKAFAASSRYVFVTV